MEYCRYGALMGLWYIINCLVVAMMALSLLGMIAYQCTVLILSKFLDNEVDIFEVLETRMCRAGWASRWPLIMTNNIAKQNTSPENRQIQLGFLAEKECILSRLCELQQQEIYLAEQLEGESVVEENPPQYQRIPERRHSVNSQEKLQQIVSEARDLWIRYKDLPFRQPKGAWIREDMRKTKREQHHRDEHQCRQYRGCCTFDCGCCMKPRSSRNGQSPRIVPLSTSHCTAWCLCCRKRDMPFLVTDDEVRR